MKKRSREEEIFDSLGDPSPEEQAQRVADLTDEEVDAKLKARGFDLEKVHAKAEALAVKMHAPKKPRSKYLIFGGGFASGGLSIAAAFAVYLASIAPVVGPVTGAGAGGTGTSGHRPATAVQWRRQASTDCDAALWRDCLEDLDAARTLDPSGDNTLDMIALRQKALDGQLREVAARSPAAAAAATRKDAFEQCGRAHWKTCIDLLDQAKTLDPAGDADPDVTNARATATRALTGGKDGG